MRKAHNLLAYILTYPLSLVSRWLPKNKKIWVFGSWLGTKYNDNSKYLFRYINKHCNDIQAIWLTRSAETLNQIRNEGGECYLMYSLPGILTTVRADKAILSRAKAEDLPIYISPYSTKIIQLWHGTPLKRLGNDKASTTSPSCSILSTISSSIRRSIFPQSNNNYSFFAASSSEVATSIKTAYGHWMQPGAIEVTGYPRNDALFNQSDVNSSLRGIYLPTFRDWDRKGETIFCTYGFDATKLDGLLGRLNAKLDMKLHPETSIPKTLQAITNESNNIRFVNYSDIHEYLGKYDFLITDYSSVYFDYLILNRPIIFAPFDLDQYISHRGIYYNYSEITPGLKAENWDQILAAIEHTITQPDDYENLRVRVNKRFNTYTDSNNCMRVVNHIRNL